MANTTHHAPKYVNHSKPEIDPIDREAIRLAADFIRAAREHAGLSYMALADRMDAHHYQVRSLENTQQQRKGPTVATLMRVAEACGKKLKLTLE